MVIGRWSRRAAVLIMVGLLTACTSRSAPASEQGPSVTLTQRAVGHLAPGLFGLGADYPVGTYVKPGARGCVPFPDASGTLGLVRIGAGVADDYDWRSDTYVSGGSTRLASFSCGAGGLASIFRLIDAARAAHAVADVVVNGEIDDPQLAAALARACLVRYGAAYARSLYWEIGDDPARWTYVGLPLAERHGAPRTASPDQYAAVVVAYAAALDAALGVGKARIVANDWIVDATDQAWTSVVSLVDTQYYPFDSPDTPPRDAGAVARGGSAAQTLAQRVDSLAASLGQFTGGRRIGLMVGGWGLDAGDGTSNPLYATHAASVFALREVVSLATHGVAFAAWSPPIYAPPPGAYAPDGTPSPAMRALRMLHRYAGATMLSATVVGHGSAAQIAASGLLLPSGETIAVVTNAGARPIQGVTISGMTGARGATVAGLDGVARRLAVRRGVVRLDVAPYGVAFVLFGGGLKK